MAVDQDNPYEILGIDEHATARAVRAAYRRMAQRLHPDRGGSTQAFVQARHAFECLSDPPRRRQIDAALASARAARATAARFSSRQRPSLSYWLQSWSDRHRPPQVLAPRGDSASSTITVTLADLVSGTSAIVRARVGATCPQCQGSNPACRRCVGAGQVLVDKRWVIKVPPGTRPGTVLRLPSRGHAGPRFSAPGDMHISLRVRRMGIWRWDDGQRRLQATLRVPPSAMTAQLRTPDGAWGTVALPQGWQSGDWLRVPGLGLPNASGVRAQVWIELRHTGWRR